MKQTLSFKEFLNKELNESPYLTDGEFSLNKPIYMSTESINRDYKKLFSKRIGISVYDVIVEKSESIPLIRIVDSVSVDDRHEVVGQLEFKKMKVDIVDTKDILQINGIHFEKKIRSEGLASTIYQALVKIGFTVVSDSTQFPPGAGIWKKLAKESHKIGLSVFVYNTDTKKFILDANGKKISYNGSNIKDNEIWTNGWNFDGEKILMVLTK